jgi:predicted neuraminidase
LAQRGIQPSLVRKKDGNLVAFMRDSPVVRRAESGDAGMTWTEDPIDIANSGSSVAALGLRSGNWILAVNDVPRGRHRLTVYLSEDEGRTWKAKRPLEDMEPGMGTGSYPTLIQAADGSIHCTYTHEDRRNFEGKTIKHVRFNEAWIMAR